MPLTLAAKEGLALINGTQVSNALALAGLFAARAVLDAALVAGAMSVDAALGSDAPFDPRLIAVRGQPGQAEVARRLTALLAGSEIRASHREGDDRVQDPYSLRCQPQVMGPCLELLEAAAATLEREANGVSDNPLVFADDGAADLGRQLPRRGGGVRRRSDRARARRDRLAVGAPHRPADRSRI